MHFQKGLPKIKCSFRPIYREMLINDNSYKVIKVAGWMRAHPSRTLEDYDRYQVARHEIAPTFGQTFRVRVAKRRSPVAVIVWFVFGLHPL